MNPVDPNAISTPAGMTRDWIATATMGCLALGMGAAYLYVPPSPYVPTGGDSVDPVVSRADGVVYVTRHYDVTRPATMRITRRLISGTCPVNCDVIDLSSSELSLEPGSYARRRAHIIPHHIPPGRYVLKFDVIWQDRLGRDISAPMPPLEIEIVK